MKRPEADSVSEEGKAEIPVEPRRKRLKKLLKERGGTMAMHTVLHVPSAAVREPGRSITDLSSGTGTGTPTSRGTSSCRTGPSRASSIKSTPPPPSSSKKHRHASTASGLSVASGSCSVSAGASQVHTKPSGIVLKGGRIRLPDKLMEYLSKGVAAKVLYWQKGGKTFSFNTNTVQTELLDKYFNKTKLTSFTRSLNRWGFKRIFDALSPNNVLTYEHKYFRAQNPELISEIKMFDPHQVRDRSPHISGVASVASDSVASRASHTTPPMLSPKKRRASLMAAATQNLADAKAGLPKDTASASSAVAVAKRDIATTKDSITAAASLKSTPPPQRIPRPAAAAPVPTPASAPAPAPAAPPSPTPTAALFASLSAAMSHSQQAQLQQPGITQPDPQTATQNLISAALAQIQTAAAPGASLNTDNMLALLSWQQQQQQQQQQQAPVLAHAIMVPQVPVAPPPPAPPPQPTQQTAAMLQLLQHVAPTLALPDGFQVLQQQQQQQQQQQAPAAPPPLPVPPPQPTQQTSTMLQLLQQVSPTLALPDGFQELQQQVQNQQTMNNNLLQQRLLAAASQPQEEQQHQAERLALTTSLNRGLIQTLQHSVQAAVEQEQKRQAALQLIMGLMNQRSNNNQDSGNDPNQDSSYTM